MAAGLEVNPSSHRLNGRTDSYEFRQYPEGFDLRSPVPRCSRCGPGLNRVALVRDMISQVMQQDG